MEKAASALRAATTVIDQHGWYRTGGYGNLRVGFCAIGALRVAIHGSTSPIWPQDADYAVYQAAYNSLAETVRLKTTGHSIGFWNDRLAEDKYEVKQILIEAAARC